MPSLEAYRQYAAKEAGPFFASTATAGSTVAALEDTASPLKSTIDQSDQLRDKWLWRPDAVVAGDKLRVIKEVDNADSLITPDNPWTNAPGAGEQYEIHGVVDPSKWAELLNEGLKRIGVVDEVTLVPVASATQHALSSHAFITKEWQVRQVGWLTTGETRATQNPFRRRVRGSVTRDVNALYIEHPQKTFAATDTIYLLVIRLAYDACGTSAGGVVFGEQSGLILETDEALPPEDLVAFSTLSMVARRAFAPIHPDERPLVAQNEERWMSRFHDRHGEFFSPPEITFWGSDVRQYHDPRDPWGYMRPREELAPKLQPAPLPPRFPALGQPRDELWRPRVGLDEDPQQALLAQLVGNADRQRR